ncbi:MAG TPA: ABC transporter permease [Steroidobacteraceae bacterium]|jgi:inositol transport system permease protein|nr:ABC transporter permease [Steroidobacteraceae bacterium]
MPPATSSRRSDVILWLRRYGTTLFLALLIVFFASQNQRFISLRNLTNILTEGSIYGIIAVGMTFVILTAGVDLSVGSLLAFAGMAGASVARLIGADLATSWLIALGTAICVGAAAGYLQGKAVTLLRIPPFIVTLGGMTIWRGATLILHDGAPISGFDQAYRGWGTGTIAHVPVPVAVFALVAALGYIVQRHTRYGRHVYAVGGNPEAARLNGLNVAAIITSVYLIVGMLSGLAGFLQSARLGAAEATAGTGYELRVIASVVIGGASLSGGRGGIGGTIIGALLIGVLTNGLVIMHVSSYWQQVIIGLIIVAAVAFDTFAKARR